MTEDAKIERRSISGVPVVDVFGEIDACNIDDLRQALNDDACKSSAQVVVSLSNATYVDSHTVHLLIDTDGQFETEGRSLRVVAPDGSRGRRVLRLAGVEGALSISGSIDEAVPTNLELRD